MTSILARKSKTFFLILKEGFELVKKINKETRKNKIFITADILFCKLFYGANPDNYYEFSFYELSNKKRSTYVTHDLATKMRKKLNNKSYLYVFTNKEQFAIKFKDYIKREWLTTKDLNIKEFKEFIKNKEYIIYKPLLDTYGGEGIEKISVSDYESYKAIYKYIKDKDIENAIIEEWIVQHDDISSLYSKAINPLRIITVNKSGKCNILSAYLAIGNGGDIANAGLNDMISPVEIDTGLLKYPAADEEGNIFIKHPVTNKVIKDTQIPYWNEILDLVNEVSNVVPEIKFVGWDIAITPQGPIIIEGNTKPGYRTCQYKSHLPNKIGYRKVYEENL